MNKKIISLVLSLILVLGSLNVVFAGSDSNEKEFVPYNDSTAYFEVYCYYSGGEASTYVYTTSDVTSASASVDMNMYVIDEYFYDHISDQVTLDSLKEFYDSDSASSSELADNRVLADVTISGASYTSGDQTFHGYKVTSSHSASITTSSFSESTGDSLEAKY